MRNQSALESHFSPTCRHVERQHSRLVCLWDTYKPNSRLNNSSHRHELLSFLRSPPLFVSARTHPTSKPEICTRHTTTLVQTRATLRHESHLVCVRNTSSSADRNFLVYLITDHLRVKQFGSRHTSTMEESPIALLNKHHPHNDCGPLFVRHGVTADKDRKSQARIEEANAAASHAQLELEELKKNPEPYRQRTEKKSSPH